ncbi:hypothetical protein [Chryseobacterium defluvii]|uniref:Uncharacterized protein n=1 Tax=Chryseobacterium defluvii TaxID=160396 RepID=A0A495SN00_9FLAO|nr:hypothetical protein [Chryseobacterium defluvii]RKT01689.1 hypothetical protein BCF58_0912 [Chryseobacterium defluvii]
MLTLRQINDPNFLVGFSRKDVIRELGDGFNFYHDKVWTYELARTWWGKKTILVLFFQNDVVCKKSIIKKFGKVDETKLS